MFARMIEPDAITREQTLSSQHGSTIGTRRALNVQAGPLAKVIAIVSENLTCGSARS